MLFGDKGSSKSNRLIIKSGYMYNLTSDSTGYEVLNTVNSPYLQPWGNIFGTGTSPTFNGYASKIRMIPKPDSIELRQKPSIISSV